MRELDYCVQSQGSRASILWMGAALTQDSRPTPADQLFRSGSAPGRLVPPDQLARLRGFAVGTPTPIPVPARDTPPPPRRSAAARRRGMACRRGAPHGGANSANSLQSRMVLRKRPGARKGGWSNEKRGRRPLLNPEVAFAIAHSLQCGMTRRDSATLSRVNRSTFFAWMKRARAEQQAGIVSQFTELLDLDKRQRLRRSLKRWSGSVKVTTAGKAPHGGWRGAIPASGAARGNSPLRPR